MVSRLPTPFHGTLLNENGNLVQEVFHVNPLFPPHMAHTNPHRNPSTSRDEERPEIPCRDRSGYSQKRIPTSPVSIGRDFQVFSDQEKTKRCLHSCTAVKTVNRNRLWIKFSLKCRLSWSRGFERSLTKQTTIPGMEEFRQVETVFPSVSQRTICRKVQR